ncbi:CAAX prenyl protease 2 [Drosophila guanche]|uniref:CAAX prenyl protease 2 n=1 Tax=Drosophila guanche TaxID=7266 RepID=A0A3B0J4X6_DROGU|nr:CAAX prenyl protease 2 [Drosophila guanche]SPP76934.1 blast:CAAX prenyl protease 2 [Drosophila guanche]
MFNASEMPPKTTIQPVLEALASANTLPQIPIITSVTCCFVLAVLYVGSLYVWSTKHNRDHPSTIKRRFASVSVVMLFSPFFVWYFSSPELLSEESFAKLLGFRWHGLWQAVVIPYGLTMLLFMGPIFVNCQNESIGSYFDLDYWRGCLHNIIWVRNHVMAPLSEEFVFRACMMPLILQSFTPMTAVFITPLFFGVAHLHHIAERLSLGVELSTALLIGLFQFIYTTLFGFYSAFLFARTGHIVAPFLVHAFCNHMGLPDLQDLWQQELWRRVLAIVLYIVGLAGWILLLPLATNPSLYGNTLYWNV